jgi:hypothetical protein
MSGYQPQPGEEYYASPTTPLVPSEGSLHDAGFCYDPSCPCHEDPELVQQLEQHRQNGEVSQDDVKRIYNGKTVW